MLIFILFTGLFPSLYLPLTSPYFSSQFTCNMIFSLLTYCSQCETYFLVHPFHISNSGSIFYLKTGIIYF